MVVGGHYGPVLSNVAVDAGAGSFSCYFSNSSVLDILDAVLAGCRYSVGIAQHSQSNYPPRVREPQHSPQPPVIYFHSHYHTVAVGQVFQQQAQDPTV